ncbi:MAG: MerR family transcriptional regulator [Ktedonobacteraceae bacterium]|nr:MerR family transcriptional regulator [Ktedonobacteraceae bacterium]MBO0794529.1 MerR family transcriptional regulator [Ktedonobacteraceae bacterium]
MKRSKKRPEPLSGVEARRMPKYTIGVVAKMVGVPPQTLRRYEEAELLAPARLDGKNRLYSDENIETLMEIVELSYQGINATGIRYILQMRQQVTMLQQEIESIRIQIGREEM